MGGGKRKSERVKAEIMNLFFYCLFLSVLCCFLPIINSFTISKTIMNKTPFYWEKISRYPSKVVKVDISIICRAEGLQMGIYTTDSNINLKKNCSVKKSGQLYNEDLFFPLRPGGSRNHNCIIISNGLLHCKGKTMIQDYIPRNYSFSFGYECDDTRIRSLKGLSFNISVHSQSNETVCVWIRKFPKLNCTQYYSFVSIPNLFGQNISAATRLGSTLYVLSKPYKPNFCYKFLWEILCYFTTPKCDPGSNSLIPPCRQACYDFINGCAHVFRIISAINCDYLPSYGTIPCFYKNVTCGPVPNITKGFIQNKISTYTSQSKVKYVCHDETYKIEGDSSIRCLYSGLWTKPPKCVPRTCPPPPDIKYAVRKTDIGKNTTFLMYSKVEYVCENETFQLYGNNTLTCMFDEQWSQPSYCVIRLKFKGKGSGTKKLQISLPLISIFLCIFAMTFIIIRCKRKSIKLTRAKTYDAFVCYAYENEDQDFAENIIRIELEEKHDPPFKLCLHRRDFQAAWDIMWNIRNAIRKSNSAIIVMSQNFVDSKWCKEEFEQCYVEHMKDPAFKLFVIMIDSGEPLLNLSEYMESFLTTKTYLMRDDPRLFKKLSKYLTWIKQLKTKDMTDVTCPIEKEIPHEEMCNATNIVDDMAEMDNEHVLIDDGNGNILLHHF